MRSEVHDDSSFAHEEGICDNNDDYDETPTTANQPTNVRRYKRGF